MIIAQERFNQLMKGNDGLKYKHINPSMLCILETHVIFSVCDYDDYTEFLLQSCRDCKHYYSLRVKHNGEYLIAEWTAPQGDNFYEQ
jgi:hypothetical protein